MFLLAARKTEKIKKCEITKHEEMSERREEAELEFDGCYDEFFDGCCEVEYFDDDILHILQIGALLDLSRPLRVKDKEIGVFVAIVARSEKEKKN